MTGLLVSRWPTIPSTLHIPWQTPVAMGALCLPPPAPPLQLQMDVGQECLLHHSIHPLTPHWPPTSQHSTTICSP